MKTTTSTKPQRPITAKQEATADFMRRFLAENDAMPTTHRIAAEFKIAQTAAMERLKALQKHGVIERNEAGGWRFVRQAAGGKRKTTEVDHSLMFAATIEVTALDADTAAATLRLLAHEMKTRPDEAEWEHGDIDGHAVAERVKQP